MMVHTICGLPRSGSTLLCNIFNENKTIHATSTSCLPNFVKQMVQGTNSIEFRNLLNINSEIAQKRIHDSIKGFTDAWCSIEGKEVVIDKGRGWTDQNTVFKQLYPDGKMIVCIRDLRDIFASIVKQDQKNGLLGGTTPILDKYNECFDGKGMIGYQLNAIINLIRTNPDNIIFVQYESFTRNPKETIETIYKELNLKPFKHDFSDVKNTSYDCDGFYLNKFPHEGNGVVKPSISSWKDWLSEDMAVDIMTKYKIYNDCFGYK